MRHESVRRGSQLAMTANRVFPPTPSHPVLLHQRNLLISFFCFSFASMCTNVQWWRDSPNCFNASIASTLMGWHEPVRYALNRFVFIIGFFGNKYLPLLNRSHRRPMWDEISLVRDPLNRSGACHPYGVFRKRYILYYVWTEILVSNLFYLPPELINSISSHSSYNLKTI